MSEKSKGGSTVSKVWAIAEPIAKELGLTLWDVRFVKEGASWFLRIFIDKEGGVTVDDCADFSHAIDKPLDDADPIDQSYYLEVSSTGIERELTRPEHFEMMQGRNIMVRLIRPLDGERDLSGCLESFKDNVITLKKDGETKEIKKSDTVWVKLDDFDAEGVQEDE